MKRVFYSAILCLALASCQKDVEPLAPGGNSAGGGNTGVPSNPGSGGTVNAGTITAVIDGKAVNFNTASQAGRTSAPGSTLVAIAGFAGTPGSSEQITLGASSTLSVTTGTYIESDFTGERVAIVGLIQPGAPSPFINQLSTTNPGKVVITAISQTSVEGTFSGDVFQMDTNGNTIAKKVITQGKFNVRFK